jgi:peptidyl-dipeptidase Dcp
MTLVIAAPIAGHGATENPFFQPSTLPFGAPPFNRITDADYLPAIQTGMARQMREIDAIANDPAPPTFDNTLVAMEKSGQLLGRALRAFYAVSQANTDPALQHVQAVIAPQYAAHQDAIYLNAKLFARVRTIYRHLGTLGLDPESRQLVKVYYQRFVHAGANLDPAAKAKLKTIDQRLSVLRTTFDRKLLAGTAAGALVVSSRAQLAGMSANSVAAAAQAAANHHLPGKWMIPLQNTTQQPALQSLDDRATRRRLFMNSWTRTEKGDANDTRDTIAQIAQLRAEKAALMGYPSYAAYALTTEMAKTPAAVQHFLAGLIPPTRAKIAAEVAELQAAIRKDGGRFALRPWDWNHYAEQVRAAKYDLDENQIRPYFELNDVLKNGLFYAANRLYGITFKERRDIPVYQPDVRVFEVYDTDGSPLGLIYFDFFKRDNKAGGAWMSNFVVQSKLLHAKPVVYNVENFTKPAPGQPALLTVGDVVGMFHEFGHALNSLFAVQEYPTLSGTNTARDFVEYPSQFNQHWALYPAVLEHYAVNYATGKPMPKSLMAKIERATTFDQGYSLGEELAADELDLAWHSLPANAPKQNVDRFETQALKASGTDFQDVPPRYRSSYFMHIWSNGYAAAYYAYNWTEMLDDDTYQWFLQHGGMTRANGQRFRDLILSRGHSEDYGPMFRSFYGKDPDVGPLLQDRGLATPPPA